MYELDEVIDGKCVIEICLERLQGVCLFMIVLLKANLEVKVKAVLALGKVGKKNLQLDS